jgi:tRNA dimethylallyltransferase
MKDKYLISVIGPTAIGKTAVGIGLAEHFKTEILSSDSRQFFREMRIGTAVPSDEELKSVRHHFIQSRSIFDDYNVGAFEKDALRLLKEKFKTRDVMIMVGGSGLYVDAVLNGLDEFPEVDPSIRQNLISEMNEKGFVHLQNQLKSLDPGGFERIDIQNSQRLIRALEICMGTGRPFSSFWMNKKKARDFKGIKIGLEADREMVYERINTRVDAMMEEGLLEEAKTLYPQRELNALQTVGYKELFAYLDGDLSLEAAVSEIKKNTRRFAKRQGTWFRKDSEIKWFGHDCDIGEIIEYLESSMSWHLKDKA